MITKGKVLHTLNKHRRLLTMIAVPVVSVVCAHLTMAASPLWTETSYFGEVDSVHHIPHNGVDFAMPEGTRVDSIVDGTVIDVRHAGDRSWGTSVHIKDLQGREVIYGHLSQPEVEVGQAVHIGQEIALSGNTGHSFGSHLHIQININGKPIDPMRDIVGAALGRH